MTDGPDDELVPVSVRLGEVVPPEDPEDWTRPLTWAAALGMLIAPLFAFGWFAVSPPPDAAPVPGTLLVAVVLAAGAAGTGATQQGRGRAFAATIATGLFAALGVVIVAAALAGERQVGTASPTLAHGVIAILAGLGGALLAALIAALVPTGLRRPWRWAVAGMPAIAVAALAVPLVGG